MYTFPIPHNLWGALFRWVFLKLCLHHVSFLLLKLKVSLKLSLGLSARNSRSSAGRETHSSVFPLQSKQQTSKLANKGCFGGHVFSTTALCVFVCSKASEEGTHSLSPEFIFCSMSTLLQPDSSHAMGAPMSMATSPVTTPLTSAPSQCLVHPSLSPAS